MKDHEKLETEQIGRLQRVELRDVWSHEAHHFTRWLEQNIDVLNDAIGFTLSIVERETTEVTKEVSCTVQRNAY